MVRITKIIYWNGSQHDEVVDVTIAESELESYRKELINQSGCLVHFEYKTLPA